MKKFLFGSVAVLGCVGLAQAADLSARMPVKAPPAPALYNWTGFYLGANLGVGVGRNPTTMTNATVSEYSPVQPEGVFGGVQAGANWQKGPLLLGFETDIQGSGMRDSHTCLFACNVANAPAIYSGTMEQKLTWFGTARARAGWVTGPVVGYVTGGFAYGGTETNVTAASGAGTSSASVNSTRTGWTLGSGVEAALDGNWTAKAEYLYVDLGSVSGATVGAAPSTFTATYREHLFRGGVNYRFNNGGSVGPAYQWAGFHLGGNVGQGIARNPSSLTVTGAGAASETFDIAPRGLLGGVQAGYDWQSGRVVYGVEADIQGSLRKDDQVCLLGCIPASTAQIEQKLGWFGTARGRLGYSVGPSLFYVTGGFAYGNVKTTVNETAPGLAGQFAFEHTKTGWVAGAGLERPFDFFGMFGRNWTMRTEYLYVDLGSVSDAYVFNASAHTLTSDLRSHVWRSALSYKFGGPVVARY